MVTAQYVAIRCIISKNGCFHVVSDQSTANVRIRETQTDEQPSKTALEWPYVTSQPDEGSTAGQGTRAPV
jgi:hypothetical protein